MIADAIIPPPEIYKSEIGSHLRCARSIPIIRRTILLLKETTTPLATQKILPRTRFILHVVPISIRTSDSSQMENRTEEGKNRKDKKRKQGKERKQNHTVVILTLTRIIKSVVTGQAPVTLELRNTPGKKHKPKVVHAYITADAIRAFTRNICSEFGSQPAMCQVHAGACVSILAPGKTDYTACHPRKTATYILHVL